MCLQLFILSPECCLAAGYIKEYTYLLTYLLPLEAVQQPRSIPMADIHTGIERGCCATHKYVSVSAMICAVFKCILR